MTILIILSTSSFLHKLWEQDESYTIEDVGVIVNSKEHSIELVVEARKHKTDAETLKGTRDKTIKKAVEAFMRADAVERRAEDIEVALREAVEENS
ncbi:hypothetical protein COCNU_10G009820 [Cocos nucifera]|uniref:Uncharacterized protein n=1 Tax=Cocos nucifera TaxID=13894 RepID=A0A8K0IP93_COCNU|nr:hypothetical protein COCNU_10G009820 [Cocos nucifera]